VGTTPPPGRDAVESPDLPTLSLEGSLADGVVTVRALGPDDVASLAASVPAGESAVWGPGPGPYSGDRAAGVVREYEEGRRSRLKAGFAALDAGGSFVGGLVLQAGPPTLEPGTIAPAWLLSLLADGPRAVEAAYWTAPPARGRGYATRGLRLLADWALETAGFRSVWLEVDPVNRVSLAVAAGAGFAPLGTLPGHCRDEPDQGPHDCRILVRRGGEPAGRG